MGKVTSNKEKGKAWGGSADKSGPFDAMTWPAMLVWVALVFALAGFIAYRLVSPFFHHT